MVLRTLDELNHDYIAGSPAHGAEGRGKPITSPVTEAEMPRIVLPSPAQRHRTAMREIFSEQPPQQYPKKKRGLFTAISDMLFSLAIIIILFIVLLPGPDSGAPKTVFNYSYFTVLSPSMQDEIPQGSFILVKQVDPRELQAGDNITYMSDLSTSVTHKIVAIYENYDGSGVRGFQTQGVNNLNPDREIVYEANVVGKVVLVIPVAGAVLSNLGENAFLVFILFALCVLLSFFLRGVFTRSAKRSLPKIS